MIVVGTGKGDFSSKPRPFLIVQSDLFADHDTLTACPLTSVISATHLLRITLKASPETGLMRDSEIQVDKIQMLRRDDIAKAIGTIPITTMTSVDDALRRWLEL